MDGGLFKATFHDSPIGIAILDEVGHYVEVNRAFARILGREPEEVVSSNFVEFTHPSDLPRDIELLSQLARDDVPYYQTQKRYLTKGGDTKWVRMTVTRIDDAVRSETHHFIAQVEDITEVVRAREQLERRAFYDGLTGLANRTLLMERLTQALANHRKRQTTVALLFFDIDDFKQVNDSLGHAAGDRLLVITAQRIQSAVRRGDTVARLGGDEFVVLLEDVRSADDAESLASIITRTMQAPVTIANHEIVPTMSAGLAVADGDTDAEELIQDADTAMYAAKRAGHALLKIYDSALREAAVTKMEVEEDLRKALRQGELAVHYQPVVDLETRNPIGYEALVRWSHPRRGVLLPEEFLAIAEQTQLVVPIGSLVIHEACAFIARHPDIDAQIFVNVSPSQLGENALARTLEAALDQHGVDPSRLAIEVTESAFLKTTPVVEADLKRIAGLEIDVVIDDFGTGRGSLSTLLEKSVSGIKLAERFARRFGDRGVGDKVSRGIALMVRDVGFLAMVKGIETEEQAELAHSHGWVAGQGYLFGHPLAEEALGLPPPPAETSTRVPSGSQAL
ncbi:MAG: EAL domain-containing protein [Demequinaceae bacterium]|nr:EAL domain-containing protein [Demequinaceae bacterium]